MPKSALQHRDSVGAYQNKHYDDFRKKITQKQDISQSESGIPNEIRRFGISISQAINSHEEFNRLSYRNTAPSEGAIAPLLLLLSQARIPNNMLLETSANPEYSSPSVSENAISAGSGSNFFRTLLSPFSHALYETEQFLYRYDPLIFPVAAASPLPSVGTESSLSTQSATGSQSTTSGWRKIFKGSVVRANHRVIKFLRDEGLLPDSKRVSKENLMYAVSAYLSSTNCFPSHENKTEILAKRILSAYGYFGEGINEKLSSRQSKTAVRDWVFKNILKTTPDKYIESKLVWDDYNSATVNDVHRFLAVDRVPKELTAHPEMRQSIENKKFFEMWKSFLMEEIPFLNFSDASIKTMALSGYNFANLYTGSRFLKEINGDDFTAEEAISTGEIMWDMATREGISEDKLNYYRAPAIFFNLANLSGEETELSNDFEAINRYLQYRKEVSEIQKDIDTKYNKFLTETKAWLSKGKLADYIISKCSNLSLGLTEHGGNTIPRDKARERAEEFAKQNYLNGMVKPCENAPDNLSDEYHKLTSGVADAFRDIDKYLVLSAFRKISKFDREFISSPDATIHSTSFSMKSNQGGGVGYGVPYFKYVNVDLKNTDLFTVKAGGEERIYALKGEDGSEDGSEDGYNIIRVDRDIEKYVSNGLLDHDFDNGYEYNSAVVKYEGFDFKYSIVTDENKINDIVDNVNSLVESLSHKHRDDLFSKLHELGNDKSDIQKIWAVAKHLIPFYDCVEGIMHKNDLQAVPACLLDAVAFIPVFGEAASVSAKFGMGIASGLRSGARVVGNLGIKAAGKNLLRSVRLPTTTELASLSKGALRALDPGFELITSAISRPFAYMVVEYMGRNKKTVALAHKIDASGALKRIPQPISNAAEMGMSPGTQLWVPVKPIEKLDRGVIYTRVNPETGERFGKKFFRDVKGQLVEVKPNHGVIGGTNFGEIVPAHLQGDMVEFKRYIKDLKAESCAASAARTKRQIRCKPLSLSTEALNQVLKYATVNDFSVLARNHKFRDSVFTALNDSAKIHKKNENILIESIVYEDMANGDSNLSSIITIGKGRENTDIYRALRRYQHQFVRTEVMKIESPKVLGTHEFNGYNSNPNIASQGVHASYTAIDTDSLVRRLNIVMHGSPGSVVVNGHARLNADELYQVLHEHGILEYDFTEIRMLVCHSADHAENGAASVAERLSELTGKPVEGYHGSMMMYESFDVGSISLPAQNMVNDAYIQGGTLSATEFMHNNKDYLSIGPYPYPINEIPPNDPETFYPFGG